MEPGYQESRPVPDPTVLTTQQLNREVDRLQKEIEHLLVRIKEEVENSDAINRVKFESIAIQFENSKTAIAAALEAVKEANIESKKTGDLAIDKSERASKEQIDSAKEQITDAKTRLTRIESSSQGREQSWGHLAGFIGLAIALITLLVLVFRK